MKIKSSAKVSYVLTAELFFFVFLVIRGRICAIGIFFGFFSVKMKLFVRYLVKRSFYREGNRYAQYPERRERTCPEYHRYGGERKRPFPAEQPIKQISSPSWYLNDCRHKQKENDGLPILAFPHYPHKKANELTSQPSQTFFYLIHHFVSETWA